MNVPEFIASLDARGLNPKQSGDGWQSRCPAHEDHSPSLSVSQGADGRLLVHCHAGCSIESVTAALGIAPADLFNGKPETNGARQIVKVYDYRDAAGVLIFQVVRYLPKDFRQRRPDGRGGWLWNTEGVHRVLYRLPEILKAAKAGSPVLICEGEKDCDALAAVGIEATCNPGGAGKWRAACSQILAGADVAIIADKDTPGRKHAQDVALSLNSAAKSVRVLELPDIGVRTVKDAHDYLAAGGQAADLMALVEATPLWTPQPVVQVATGTADIRGNILDILTNDKLTVSEQRTQIGEAVVMALEQRGRFYFHEARRDFDSAMCFDATRKRLERIKSDAFTAWLSDWLRVNRADGLFKYVLAQVETAALSGSQTTGIIPESFWASRPGAVYLSNGDGGAVKITPGDAVPCDNGTDGVLFAAGRTLLPWKLTDPKDPFETCALFRNVHCSAGHGRDLLRVWLCSLPTNPACKPPMVFAGTIGSGKTRTAKGIAELYGFSFVAHKVDDFGEDSFWASMDGGGVFTLDNADTRVKWLPDAIANAATDGCSQRRKLYTNSETVTLRARAWLCLTTANPTFASDAGLADRLMVVRMNRREDETSDAALTAEVLANRDAGLSFFVHTLAKALADTKPVPPGLNARHPDFGNFAVRIGRACSREFETVAALRAAEQDKALFCVENDTIGAAVLAFLSQAHEFTGTGAELRGKLTEIDPDLAERVSVRSLGKRLTNLWPHLCAVLASARHTKDRKGFTVYTLKARSADYAEFETPFST